jgi:hypothetical protein
MALGDHEPIQSMEQRVYKAGLDSQRIKNFGLVGSMDTTTCKFSHTLTP